jgi:uncharacterized protein
MPPDSDRDPSFHISDRSDPSTTVVAGFSAFGLAGLTAADYLVDPLDLTVFVNELFLPTFAADPFADALLDWTDGRDVEEILVLSGVPFAHGPDEHATFFVASDDYRERRLDGVDIEPMSKGFLDGINGAITSRGIESSLHTAVFITPVHEQVPDVPAAIRLIEAFDRVCDLGVDAGPLGAFAGTVEEYYRNLADRLAAADDGAVPEDRMYM